ncbi:MAG: beta-galactosidase [Armatimonadota bacterium]
MTIITIVSLVILLYAISGSARSETAGSEPYVGFIWHYPFVDVGTSEISKSGATVMNSRAVWAAIEPEEGRFDFSTIDRQLEVASKNGFKLILVLEFNPFCKPQWVNKKVQEADQSTKGFFGHDGGFPRSGSTVLLAAQENFLRNLVDHINKVDTNHIITHYQAGIEWWFPPSTRYAEGDVIEFRNWLSQKYGSVDKLNSAWKTKYSSFNDVQAPMIDVGDLYMRKREGLSRPFMLYKNAANCVWRSSAPKPIQVTPGKTYEFSSWVRTKKVISRGAYIALYWFAKDGKDPFLSTISSSLDGSGNWRKLSVRSTAPANADHVILTMSLEGFGDASFDSVSFKEEGSVNNLAYDPEFDQVTGSTGSWGFENVTAQVQATGESKATGGRNNSRCINISVPANGVIADPYGNIQAAAYDWQVFWEETAAEYINSLARMVKKYDPSRSTASFLTETFAFSAEWDYTQWSAVRPDEVAMRAKNIDVFGLQLCSAEGDPYRITAGLDLVRKYGKPMWNLDLLDFAAGSALPEDKMLKVTHSSIQHGATGLIFCNWNGAKDFNFYPDWPMDDLNSMITDARLAIKLMDGMKIKAKTAIINPFLPTSPADKSGLKNDVGSYIGWYKLLDRSHKTVDVVTLRELEHKSVDLSAYDWILVPDCAYIPRQALSTLGVYAANGGKIINGGRFAVYDQTGLPIADGKIPGMISLIDYGKKYAGKLIRDGHAGDTPPQMILQLDTPAAKSTKTKAVKELKSVLTKAGIRNDVEISAGDQDIRCVEYEGQGNRVFYLVNMSEKPASKIKIRVLSKKDPQVKVWADVRPVECTVTQSNLGLDIIMPEFKTSCIVKITD